MRVPVTIDPYRIVLSEVSSTSESLRSTSAAHSKSVKHHEGMQAIYFCFFTWCRRHETLKMTPAESTGIADKQWTILELLQLVA